MAKNRSVSGYTLEELPSQWTRLMMQTPLERLGLLMRALDGDVAPQAPRHGSTDLVDMARDILEDVAIGRGHRRGRISAIEGAIVHEALKMTNGNVSAAARLIGIDRKAMERKVRRHKVAGPRRVAK